MKEKLQNSWHNVRGASTSEMEENAREAEEKYGDILHLPHHEPKTRPRQPMSLRAAQFAPFAALSGYDDAIKESARRTQKKPELTEDRRQELDEKRKALLPGGQGSVLLTHFVKDEKKDGGTILEEPVRVRRVDTAAGTLILMDGRSIRIEDVLDLSESETDKENDGWIS